jgi:acetoin utilization protein AcuB
MNPQLAKDWMTRSPVTITEDTSLTAASRLMQDNDIRRLPVVEHGKVVGIVTWGDIREASASDATSLTVFELGYLLKKLQVDRFMTRHPITVTPTTTISRAAQLMMEHKIGGLPVVENGKLVGILTESDIFRMLATANAA